jgi:hypothetical protein
MLSVIMTAATFKKIAQPKTTAKSEIHIVLPPYPGRSITELLLQDQATLPDALPSA